jgi:hypothetical protein
LYVTFLITPLKSLTRDIWPGSALIVLGSHLPLGYRVEDFGVLGQPRGVVFGIPTSDSDRVIKTFKEKRQGVGKGEGLGGRTLAGMEYIYT